MKFCLALYKEMGNPNLNKTVARVETGALEKINIII